MPCYKPLQGWLSRHVNPSGKRSVVFRISEGFADKEQSVPCGQCIGCRIDKSVEWAIRSTHESQLYEQNVFLTLTYSEAHVPLDGSISVRDLQLFWKNLRKSVAPKQVRYIACGEYGDKYGRPHYHACVFGLDFPDKFLYSTRDGIKNYTSPALDSIWNKGRVLIGEVTFESAAYVARYLMQKTTGEMADFIYDNGVDEATGEILQIRPEFLVMSRNPGLGAGWFKKYQSDVFPHDFVVLKGVKYPVPKFYDTLMSRIDPIEMSRIKSKRTVGDEDTRLDNDSFRLPVKEKVLAAKISLLKRGFEDD